jgi:putative membrane protein
MFRYVLVCTLSVVAVGGALAQTTGQSGSQARQKTERGAAVDQKTTTFIKQAAEGGRFEIESSKLAQQRGRSPEVKSFAEKMVHDHTQANKQLADAAQKAGTTVPDVALTKKHATTVSNLRERSGAAFDRAYADAQVTAHQETVELFSTYSKQESNPAIKQFAEQTLPKLRQHLDMAKDMSRSVEGGAATGASGGGSGSNQKKN